MGHQSTKNICLIKSRTRCDAVGRHAVGAIFCWTPARVGSGSNKKGGTFWEKLIPSGDYGYRLGRQHRH